MHIIRCNGRLYPVLAGELDSILARPELYDNGVDYRRLKELVTATGAPLDVRETELGCLDLDLTEEMKSPFIISSERYLGLVLNGVPIRLDATRATGPR